MNVTPAPFLRIGFVFLAFCVALSVGLGQARDLGSADWVAAAIVFAVLGGAGELLFRRIAARAGVVAAKTRR